VLDGTTRHPKPETLAALGRAAEVAQSQKAADAALQARLREQLDAWRDRDAVEGVAAATLGVELQVLGKMLVGRRRISLKVVRVMDRRGLLD
jgi:hypothetical protein